MSLLRTLEEALAQHVSAINARVIVERGRRVLLNPAAPTREEHARLVSTVRATVRLFTSDTKATEIIEEIERRLLATGARADRCKAISAIFRCTTWSRWSCIASPGTVPMDW